MEWRKKHEKDQQLRHRISVVVCTILGGLIGAAAGLGVCVYLIPFTILFPGDTMVAGALLFGGCGYVYGEPFADWLIENWWHVT